MKTLGVVLLAATCLVASTHGFPGARNSDSDESKNVDTVLVLPSETRDRLFPIGVPDVSFDDSDENPSWVWQSLFRPSFLDGWYSSIQAHMKSLRDQMAGFLSRIPEEGGISWGKIPEGANTTSVTKVIDGHVVTINETTYMDGDDEHGTLVRVRIVDVKPQNDTLLEIDVDQLGEAGVTTTSTPTSTAVPTTEPPRSVETVEEFDNEIPKNQVDTLTA